MTQTDAKLQYSLAKALKVYRIWLALANCEGAFDHTAIRFDLPPVYFVGAAAADFAAAASASDFALSFLVRSWDLA